MAGHTTEVRKILDRLCKHPGWTYEMRKRSSHYKITSPEGKVVFAASTPSDRRSILNMLAHLRKLGAPL